MMHHISGFTLSILLTIPIIVETSDSLFDSGDILLPSNGELPDDTTDLFTNNGELLSSFDETLASAQSDCTSNGDIDNLFFSSDIARLRPRINACLPPLPSIINIYDSNAILNQFAPSTFSKPDIQIPSTQKKQNPDVLRLDELFNLPAYTHDINPTEQDDVCPEELFDKSQTPVCQAEKWARNTLRRPKEDYYTLWNVRKFYPTQPCRSRTELWCCFEVKDTHHPLDPPGAPDVPTGFLCLNVETEEFAAANPNAPDPWRENRELDEGQPLYDSETEEESWGF